MAFPPPCMKTACIRLGQWNARNASLPALLLLFLIAFALFAHLQFTDTFADPDSFYHAKAALLTAEHGPIRDFPWLPLTVLQDRYADQHFLYHVLLIPFIAGADPLVGMKVAAVLFGAAFVALFYWILKKLHVRWAWWFALALLAVEPLTFRMSLAKAPSVSLLLLLLGLFFLFSYRAWHLGALAFLYVWFYGGFPVLLVAVGFFVLAHGIVRLTRRDDHHRFVGKVFALLGRKFRDRPVRRHLVGTVGAAVAGLTLGLVVNPFFPKNILFAYHQLVQIGILNFRDTIGVGGEWYSYAPIELMTNTIVLSVALAVALPLFALTLRKQTKASWTALLLWAFFLALTLKSRRYVEYYVPMGMLFAALATASSLRGVDLKREAAPFLRFARRSWATKLIAALIVGYIAIALPALAVRDLAKEKRDLRSGSPMMKFQKSATWLAQHSRQGDLVVHSDWDEFPLLWYWNDTNAYVAGLDATFFYERNRDLYWKWVDLTTGKPVPDLHTVIARDFGARYVFLERDHAGMDATVRAAQGFTLVYEDPEARIYRVE